MNEVDRALRAFLAARPQEMAVALVGGIAVGVRTEPRFTRDLDFAVAVDSDADAEGFVLRMRQLGYEVGAALEQASSGRLSTVRLRKSGRGPVVDLLFAACGIESEIVAAAEPIEVVRGVVAPVARTGHLIAMKLVSVDDQRRPFDRADLVALGRVADELEWARAAAAVRVIEERGFQRKRDLQGALADLRERAEDL